MASDEEAKLRERLERYGRLLVVIPDERAQPALLEGIAELGARLDYMDDGDDTELAYSAAASRSN